MEKNCRKVAEGMFKNVGRETIIVDFLVFLFVGCNVHFDLLADDHEYYQFVRT